MSVTYTEQEFDEQWNISLPTLESDNSTHDEVDVCPQYLGNGYRQAFQLRSQIWVEIVQETYREPWQLTRQHPEDFPLTAKFYLSGRSQVNTHGIGQYEERGGQSYLYCLPDTWEVEEYDVTEPMQVVTIWVPPEFLQSFAQDRADLAPELWQFMQGESLPFFHQAVGKITPEVRSTLNQLIHCPYGGLARQMYLESLVLKLFSLQFHQWAKSEQRSQQSCVLRSSDIERLYEARTILLKNMQAPPLLPELARQVGLNERKLKEGFRHVFGTTVFGYLHDQRLEQAQQLLRNQNLTIDQIAKTIGFANRSYFAAAFRKKFGLNPSEFRESF